MTQEWGLRKVAKSRGMTALFCCPICHAYQGEDLGEHIRKVHGEESFRAVVLMAKQSGMPDARIGEIFRITFRQLERIVTEAYGANVSTLKRRPKRITAWEPKGFREETTTVWSYPQRGNWATHHGGYRGNWSPYIPRNVILKYSKPGEVVLDYFVGGGTTAIEAKLLRRRCIARDINPVCVAMTKEHLDFVPPAGLFDGEPFWEPDVSVGDARNLEGIGDSTIDLICAHPPYAGIINYSSAIQGDLSALEIEAFLGEMRKVAQESFRVLKPGRKCAILIGDTRKRKHVVPIGFRLIQVFLDTGFRLKELVIKRQHNCKTTGFWKEKSVLYNFLLLAHEYLPIFEKPENGESPRFSDSLSGPGIVAQDVHLTCTHNIDLEATSVWIFPEDQYDSCLDTNILRRYHRGGKYRAFALGFAARGREVPTLGLSEPLSLLVIKSPLLAEAKDRASVFSYLSFVRDFVSRNIVLLLPGAFLVVETQDVRVDGYIEPLGLQIVNSLNHERLWLKEIVIVVRENQHLAPLGDQKELAIVHRYLLVYEVLK